MKKKQNILIDHLEALRTVLVRSLIALAIGLLPMFAAAPYIMDALIRVIMAKNILVLNYFTPLEVFVLQIKIALLFDVLLCFPYIAKQVWKFVCPALYSDERKFIKSAVLSSSILFVFGVLSCLFLILPPIMRFGMSFAGNMLRPMWGIGNVLSLALWLSFIFGLMFQFPLIIHILLRFGIVSYDTVKNKRAYVFTGILILSALLTPPDIISQIMLTLPTYGLFEIGLFFGKK